MAAVYQATGTVTEGHTTDIPWPTHLTDDYAILVVVQTKVARASVAVATLSTASGFTAVAGGNAGAAELGGSGGGVRVTLFEHRATSAAMAAPQVADITGTVTMSFIITFRGCLTTGSAADVVSATNSGTGGSVTITGADPSVAGTVVLVAFGASINSANTIGSWTNADLTSITERADANASGATNHIAGATGGKTTDTAYGNTTASCSELFAVTWAGVTVALRPAVDTARSTLPLLGVC